MPITDTRIKTAKPKEKPYKLTDGGGLYLQIQPTGAKYWRLAYRYTDKQKTLAIGVYPEITLAQARLDRDKARKLLASGTDPATAMSKRVKKKQQLIKTENSFEAIAREWHENEREGWSKDYASSVIKSMGKEVFPYIGHIPLKELTAPLVLEVLRKVESRDALELASKTLQRCSAVFRFAIQTGRAEYNPVTDLKGALKTRKVIHRAALSRADLPEFLTKLSAYDGHMQTRLALNLVVLTFVRTGEIRGARWDEFDLDRAEWRIPAERMKMRSEHIVPLSQQALATLDELKPLSGHRELLFPSEKTWKKPISENTMLYAMYRMGYHGTATVHGFRATASTILNESGFKSDVIERQLAHAERNKVRAAYNRSEYLEERKKMMQWWADFLEGIKNNKNVVPIMINKK